MNKIKVSVSGIILSIVLFMVGGGLVLAAAQYPKTYSESGTMRVELNTDKPFEVSKPVIVDIKKEGLPKRLVQPGRISISTGHGAGIVNKGTKPVNLGIRLTGLPDNTELTSTDKSFDSETGEFRKVIDVGGSISVTIELDIPRSQISSSSQLIFGKLEFIDLDLDSVIMEIPISVINSGVK